MHGAQLTQNVFPDALWDSLWLPWIPLSGVIMLNAPKEALHMNVMIMTIP